MEVKQKSILVVVLIGFSCTCQSIYVPGRNIAKPPVQREILARPALHRHSDSFENNITDYSGLEVFNDKNTVVNVGRDEPEYRSVELVDEKERDIFLVPGREGTEEAQVPFIVMVTGDRWVPNPDREVVAGTQVVVECPRGATGQFPYPPNCLYFLNCWKGRGFTQLCAPGTLFNPKTLECDFPSKVKCLPYVEASNEARPPRTPVEHGTGHTASQHQYSTPRPSQPAPRSPHQQITCDMEGGTGLAPHPSDCSKFINCWQGRPYIQPCGPGTLFNPSILQCDYPHNVNCLSENSRSSRTDSFPPSPQDTKERPRTSTEVPTVASTTVTYPTTASTAASTVTVDVDVTSPSTPDVYPVELVEASGQVLRLRGGSGPWEGYVEIRGSSPGWGLVCDDSLSWTIQEANVVCRQLGYERGAEFAWQGRPVRPTDDTLKVSVDAVTCSGNEATLASCRLSYGHQRCVIARDAIGVRCHLNSASQCNPEDASFAGKCYTLVEAGQGAAFTHGEAIQHCKSLGGHLLDINSQAENDFISEWLIQLFPEITSVITSGIGVNVGGSAVWIWEGSKKPFRFEKWWPGWTREYGAVPETGDTPLCVEAKRVFPCDMSYYSSQEQGDRQMCGSNYFYWDTEECSITHSHPYICEKPHHNIGCVTGTGQDYTGAANVTVNGMPCIHWDLDEVLPYLWPKVSEEDRVTKLSGHNHCRNVGGTESHPWCFVGPRGKMELCDIPVCWSSEILRNPSEESFKCGINQFHCQLNECIESSWVCDGFKDCSNGRDELSCNRNLKKFTVHAGSRLVNHDVEKWIRSDPNTCSRQCLEAKHFHCLSFSYNSKNGSCFLSNSNIGLSGDLQVDNEWNYYERKSSSINCGHKFVCANGKCVNASAECDGKNDCGDRSDERNCSVEYLDYSLRLAGGDTSYEGRVEVKVFGRWGVLCDDKFGLRDADVVCRELGFGLGAADVKSNSFFGPHNSNPLFLVDDLQCLGNETSIRECDFNGWGVHDCASDEVAGVVCKVPGKQCPENNWQCRFSKECIHVSFLCDNVADCDDGSDESAECQVPTPRSSRFLVGGHFVKSSAPIKEIQVLSLIEANAVFSLVGNVLGIAENVAQVRLVGGSSSTEGRVEVLYMGTWGTVCDDDFTSKSARVVCRSLGFGGPAEVRKDATFGAGEGIIWLDQVHCLGNESNIEDCFHPAWGKQSCNHNEDVGVVCAPGKVSRESDVDSLEPVDVTNSSNYVSPVTHILPADCGAINLEWIRDEIQNPRVVRGKETVKGMYPWQASVRVRGPSKTMHWCGAVIISTVHVLTAGHCLSDYNKEAYYIRVADHDTEVNDGSEQEVNIEEIYLHEEFNKGPRLNNDIAVVKLKGRGIMLGKEAQPICLPPPQLPYSPGLNCTISGWGSTKAGGSGYARKLQATWLPILARDTCTADFVYGAAAITDGMFCAGLLEGGVDACQGDSGGPMVCLHDGHFTLFGIISWGHGCGRPNKPGVYSNIAYYRNWIDQKIQDSMAGR